MLNLEKSILQRERGFFFFETVWMPAFVMLLHESNFCLKRMLSASFVYNLITLDYAAKFLAGSCNLNYFVLISSFMDILPVSWVLVAFSSVVMTLG